MRQPRTTSGFTLIELLVVISLIMLMAAAVIPSTAAMFRAGQESQAYNMLAARLAEARAWAVRTSEYAGVHCGLADPRAYMGRLKGTYYLGTVEHKGDPRIDQYRGSFRTVQHSPPTRLPGTIALGQISPRFVDTNGNFVAAALEPATPAPPTTEAYLDPTYLFTDFTIVFDPKGCVVTSVPPDATSAIGNVVYAGERFIAHNSGVCAELQFWDSFVLNNGKDGPGWPGVTSVAMFDFTKFEPLDGAGRARYLNENGYFLPVNVYTGELAKRK